MIVKVFLDLVGVARDSYGQATRGVCKKKTKELNK
jgi:hypothetical protein